MKIYNPLFALLLSAFVGEVLAAAIHRADGPPKGNGVDNGQSKQNIDDPPTGSGVYVFGDDDEDWNPYRHYGMHGNTGGKDWEHDHIIETHHTEQSDDDGKNKSHYISDKKFDQDRSNGDKPNDNQQKGKQGGDSGKTPPTSNQGSVKNGSDGQKGKETPPPADQKTQKTETPVDQKVSDTKPPAGQKVDDTQKANTTQPPTGNTQPPAGNTQPPAGNTQPPAGNTQPPKDTKAPVDPKAKDTPAPVDQNAKGTQPPQNTPPPAQPAVDQNLKGNGGHG